MHVGSEHWSVSGSNRRAVIDLIAKDNNVDSDQLFVSLLCLGGAKERLTQYKK